MTNSARALHATQLTPDEVERILQVCGTDALLVGVDESQEGASGFCMATFLQAIDLPERGMLS